jgi:hypothetical protein
MVSRQETARPLLTPGEVMQLPDEAVVMVSSVAPIKAKKLRYYADAISSGACCRRPCSRPGATPTCRHRGPTTGAGWRFPPCPPHRPLHRRWPGALGTDDGGPRRQPELSETVAYDPELAASAPTSGCSMTTTTCRFPFLASSIRPCSARPGWLPRPQRRNRAMSHYRLNLFIQPEHAKRLDELAAKKGVSKSSSSRRRSHRGCRPMLPTSARRPSPSG